MSKRGKKYDIAVFSLADGGTGCVEVMDNGRVYLLLESSADYSLVSMKQGKKEPSGLSVRPLGSEGQGKCIADVLAATPDSREIRVRSRASGLVTVTLEGSWGLTWNRHVKTAGKNPYWHFALRLVE